MHDLSNSKPVVTYYVKDRELADCRYTQPRLEVRYNWNIGGLFFIDKEFVHDSSQSAKDIISKLNKNSSGVSTRIAIFNGPKRIIVTGMLGMSACYSLSSLEDRHNEVKKIVCSEPCGS